MERAAWCTCARWYQPRHGRFTSRDPFVWFDTVPHSLHPYQYAYSNPVLQTDPSGQCVPVSESVRHPGCQSDESEAVEWLLRDLLYYSRHRTAQSIKISLTAIPAFWREFAQSTILGSHYAQRYRTFLPPNCQDAIMALILQTKVYVQWTAYVAPNQPLDVKGDYFRQFGRRMKMFGLNVPYDASGNILYGYVGKYVGFSELELYNGAGVAQYVVQCATPLLSIKVPNFAAMGPGALGCLPIDVLGGTYKPTAPSSWDDARDQGHIEVGLALYTRYGSLFATPPNQDQARKQRALRQVLLEYRHRLK